MTTLGAIGFSGMMHGYLPFDGEGRQLAEFRTWRNTITGPASEKLSELFRFNIPQRWSVAHLYQAILNGEEHVGEDPFPYDAGRLYPLEDDREKKSWESGKRQECSQSILRYIHGTHGCWNSLMR